MVETSVYACKEVDESGGERDLFGRECIELGVESGYAGWDERILVFRVFVPAVLF